MQNGNTACKCGNCNTRENVQSGNAVVFRNVSVKLGGVSILENINAVIPRESCTAIVGPNGAGKTTLTLAMLGEIPYDGKIEFINEKGIITGKPPRIGFVPQKLQFDRTIPLTVMEFLASGIQRFPIFLGISGKFREKAIANLKLVDCDYTADRKLGTLSGGELQRVLLAQAILQDPEILILDEPAAGVDFKGEKLCCELLDTLREKLGFTQIIVSHDLSMVSAHASHVICLNRKLYAEGHPKIVLTPAVLSETFGIHMGIPDSNDIPDAGRICNEPCCQDRKKDRGME